MNQDLLLTNIHVCNLFNRFDYDIDLRNNQNISILIAPNGCGKTTVFNLISFIFNPTLAGYSNAVKIPFGKIECYLTNGNIIILEKMKRKVTRNKKKKETKKYIVIFEDDEPSIDEDIPKSEYDLILRIEKPDNKQITPMNITEDIEKIIADIKEEPFFDEINIFDADITNDEDITGYPRSIRAALKLLFDYYKKIRDFLSKSQSDITINFIKADRLHKQGFKSYGRFFHIPDTIRRQPSPLEMIQKKTQKLIKEINDEYSGLQSEAKDQLPGMYLNNSVEMDFETFYKRWNNYINNINKYSEIGLIAKPQPILKKSELKNAYERKNAFLAVYLNIFEKTLVPLEREYKKLKLFKDILDQRNRITGKTITYSMDGIVITVDGEHLPLECLSSGEKNDFVMFYNLIFDSKDNSMVLVDEPEISLHIEWQEAYLDFLIDICKMNHLQALVATHSPNIINGHFELYAKRGLIDGC